MSRFIEVNQQHPCQCCGGASYPCRQTEDGWHHCGDLSATPPEGWRLVTSAKGNKTWRWHEKGQGAPPHVDFEESWKIPLGSPDLRHSVYTAMLDAIDTDARGLNAEHRGALGDRGFTPDEITRCRFFSYPRTERVQFIADAIKKRVPLATDELLSVPGFLRQEKTSTLLRTFEGGALGIPVRDVEGRIVAMRVRIPPRAHGEKKRYVWLSAGNNVMDGCSPGATPHVPLHDPATRGDTVRVTEGELKAEIATLRTGILTLSVPGVSTWPTVLPVLRDLRARRVLVAYDADARRKPLVATALQEFAAGLNAAGFEVALEVWPEEVQGPDGKVYETKGIDDVLVRPGGGPGVIEVLEGAAAWEGIGEMVASAGAKVDPCLGARAVIARHAAAMSPNVALSPAYLEAAATLYRHAKGDFFDVKDAVEKLRKGLVGDWTREVQKAAKAAEKREEKQRKAGEGRAARDSDRAPGDHEDHRRTDGAYVMTPGRIEYVVKEADENRDDGKDLIVCAARFSGLIKRELHEIDGSSFEPDGSPRVVRLYEIELVSEHGAVRTVTVPTHEFSRMKWADALGGGFVVEAGSHRRDYTRGAIEVLSGPAPVESSYLFTGWHRHAGEWTYLHAAGAINEHGVVEGVKSKLTDESARRYALPEPSTEPGDAQEDLRACFDLMNAAGPDDILLPVLGAAWRAVLGENSVSVFVVGSQHSGKTLVASLAAMHFGAGLDADHPAILLPGGATQHAVGKMRAMVGDAVLLLDDWMLTGDPHNDAEMQSVLQKLSRMQFGSTGRKRATRDGQGMFSDAAPRSLSIITGEHWPNGESLTTRLVPVHVDRERCGDLSQWDAKGRRGEYARGMATHVRWLAGRLDKERAISARQALEFRAVLMDGRRNAERVCTLGAQLLAGIHSFLRHALEVGLLDASEAEGLAQRALEAMRRMCDQQSAEAEARNPALMFVDAIRACLISGACHLADQRTRAMPKIEAHVGWRVQRSTPGVNPFDTGAMQPCGPCIGHVSTDGKRVFIELEAALNVAMEFCKKRGEPIVVRAGDLPKRLKALGLLTNTALGTRETYATRRRIAGVVASGLEFATSTIVAPIESSQTPPATQGDETRVGSQN